MKYIKNYIGLAIAICAMILAIAYFIDTGIQGIESGKVVSGIMFVLLSIYSFFGGFITEKVPKELSIITDERDDLIISKAGKMTIKIMGVLLGSMWLISFGLYALFKHIVLLTVTVTLSCILVIMFFTLLLCNYYYEKRN